MPNVKVDTYGVYTNNTPSGAFRSFGALQAQFATETHLDICAEKLGLDPFEIRRINAMRDGAVTHTKQTLKSVSLVRASMPPSGPPRWEAGAPTVARGRAGRPGWRRRAPAVLARGPLRLPRRQTGSEVA